MFCEHDVHEVNTFTNLQFYKMTSVLLKKAEQVWGSAVQ